MKQYRYSVASYEQLKKYLRKHNKLDLLSFVKQYSRGFSLDESKYKNMNDFVTRYRLACIFTVLEEYEIADRIHVIIWRDLSRYGDTLGNSIIANLILSNAEGRD